MGKNPKWVIPVTECFVKKCNPSVHWEEKLKGILWRRMSLIAKVLSFRRKVWNNYSIGLVLYKKAENIKVFAKNKLFPPRKNPNLVQYYKTPTENQFLSAQFSGEKIFYTNRCSEIITIIYKLMTYNYNLQSQNFYLKSDSHLPKNFVLFAWLRAL